MAKLPLDKYYTESSLAEYCVKKHTRFWVEIGTE